MAKSKKKSVKHLGAFVLVKRNEADSNVPDHVSWIHVRIHVGWYQFIIRTDATV